MKKELKNNNLKCAFCRGKGIHPNSERLPCIVCRGRGKVEISQPYAKCEECGGSGRKLGTNLYCLSCQGKGFVKEKVFLKSTKPTNNCQDWKKELKEKENNAKKKNNNIKRKPEKKIKEIKKRPKPIKPFVKKISAQGGSALGGKKKASWLSLIKEEWKSIWKK